MSMKIYTEGNEETKMKTLQELNDESKMFNENDDFSIEELVNHVNEIEEFIVNNPGYAYVDYNDEHYNVYSFICREIGVPKYLKNVFEVAAVLVNRDGKCYDLPKDEIKSLVGDVSFITEI